MAKKLRMIYVMFVYILAMPFWVLGMIGTFLYGVFESVKEHDLDHLETIPMAFFDGTKNGHKINMQWVKHGNKYTEWNFWEEKA